MVYYYSFSFLIYIALFKVFVKNSILLETAKKRRIAANLFFTLVSRKRKHNSASLNKMARYTFRRVK